MNLDLGIDFSDFEEGFGAQSQADLDGLNKALSAGDGQAVPGEATAGSAKPIMPESLDRTLASLTYTEEDFPFWRRLAKERAYNTAEEFNQLLAVGQGEAGFIGEGDLPEEEDSTYRRNVTLVKFLGTTRRVTHVASLVRTVGVDNAIAAETRDGTVWLMRILEENLFFGDSSLVPVQFDGLKKQLVDGGAPVYDIRGGYMTLKIVNSLCAIVRRRPNYGRVNAIFSSTGVKSDIIQDFYQYMRAKFGEQVRLGITTDVINTQQGPVDLIDDIYIEEGAEPFPNGTGNTSKRPLTPALNSVTVQAATGTTKWLPADSGDYYYKVVGLNRYGRSTAVTSSATTVAGVAGASDEVKLNVTDGGQNTTAYIVYRSEKDGAASTAYEAFRVARTAATQDIFDRNLYLPGTSTVFGLTMRPDVLKWKQLAPFTKIPLATIDTSIRWMMVLYGALQVQKPRYNFVINNVGRDPASVVIARDIDLDGY